MIWCHRLKYYMYAWSQTNRCIRTHNIATGKLWKNMAASGRRHVAPQHFDDAWSIDAHVCDTFNGSIRRGLSLRTEIYTKIFTTKTNRWVENAEQPPRSGTRTGQWTLNNFANSRPAPDECTRRSVITFDPLKRCRTRITWREGHKQAVAYCVPKALNLQD